MSTATSFPFQYALSTARALPPKDQLRLIADLAAGLQGQAAPEDSPAKAKRSLLGVLAHLGPAPTEENFAEARRAMTADFFNDEDAP